MKKRKLVTRGCGCFGCGGGLLAVIVIVLALVIIVPSLAGSKAEAEVRGQPGVMCTDGTGVPAVIDVKNERGETVKVEGVKMQNVRVVIAIGKEVNLPKEAWAIALATALVESRFENLKSGQGDRDSVGMFQQRPSQGWGLPQELEKPEVSSRKFYDALKKLGNWQDLPFGDAAQRVQRSAFPEKYAKVQDAAFTLVGALEQIQCQGQDDSVGMRVVAAAKTQLDVPYVWGGESLAEGGFDCSGLVMWAYKQVGITLPGGRPTTETLWNDFKPPITDRNDLRPGDLIMLHQTGNPSNITHVGMYAGDGRVVEAPTTGIPVRIWPTDAMVAKGQTLWTTHYGRDFAGILRVIGR